MIYPHTNLCVTKRFSKIGVGVYAVILAGGKGERLWPMSKKSQPKYLLRLGARGFRSRSLLEQTMDRIKPLTKNIIIVTTKQQRKYISIDHRPLLIDYIIESKGRNTANAIRLAATHIVNSDPDGIMVVLPADQIVKDNDKFCKTLNEAIRFIERNEKALMTIGIRPTHAETGYGYIKINSKFIPTPLASGQNAKCYRIEKFIEKPNLKKAKKFINDKCYLWNSGMFVWKAKTIIDAIKRYMPGLEPVSIDHGVMEKAKDVYVTKGDFDWIDVGSWQALEGIVIGRYVGVDTERCIIISDERHLIGTIGLSGFVVIHTDDATLICPKDRSQDVKALVEEIKKRGLKKYL